jgi:m7GpppX diphosphatase
VKAVKRLALANAVFTENAWFRARMGGMTACLQHVSDYSLLAETPEMYARPRVAKFIEQEVARPSKQWISHIIDGKQEADEVVCRTPAFVLLPDTERVNRYWRIISNCSPKNASPATRHHRRVLNWLAIAQDRRLRTMRDLRGEHVPMLKTMLDTCMRAIEAETGIRRDQVMAYVHYPPSVYQLHIHFSYPYGQYCHRDAYRVHNLATIINNLEIDPDYYAKATLHMALYRQSLHYAALTDNEPCDNAETVNATA